MGLEELTQEMDIEGARYQITPLPFGRGRRALMRLVKVLSPLLSAALRDGVREDKMKMVAAVLDSLPTSLSDADLEYFAKEFGDASRFEKDGKWVPLVSANQETHFAGRYLAFLRWVTASARVNFADFFAGIVSGGAGADLTEMLGQPAKAS